MAISWGSWDTNIRVGIDMWASSQSDTSVTYQIAWWIESRYTIADTMVMRTSGTGVTTENNEFYMSNSGGGTMKVRQEAYTRSKVYGGGPTISYSGSISGHFDGGTPSQSRSATVPARPADPPDQVGTPSVSGITGTKATLDWNAPGTNGAGISGYQIHLSTSSSFSNHAHNSPYTASGSGITWSSGLTPGQTYYARVRANSSAGYGSWSGTRSWTQLDTPGKVGLPTISNLDWDSCRSSWSAPSTGGSAITGYDIQLSTNSSFSGASNYTRTTLYIDFTGLAKGTTYYTRTRATNSVGDGDWSSARSFKTNNVPNAPSTPTSTVPSATSVRFAWSAPANNGETITGYDVQLSLSSSFSSVLQTQTTTSLNYTFSDLDRGVTYYGRVRAKNAAGTGSFSGARSATTYWEDLSIYPTPTPTLAMVAASQSHRALFRVDIIEGHPFPEGTRTVGYELSQDAGFASPISDEVTFESNVLYGALAGETMTFNDELQMGFAVTLPEQGQWYLRVRTAGSDSMAYSSWTTGQFTSTHVPVTTVISPSSDTRILYGPTNAFSFSINDPAPSEPMTAYHIQIDRNDTGASVLDTGKTTAALAEGTNTVSLAVPSGEKDQPLRWRVMVWDSTDVESLWSGYAPFRVVDAPVVAITAPADAGEVTTGAPTVTWTVGLTSGRVQSTATVRILDDAGEQVWQRIITGTTKTATPSTPVLINGNTYTATVTVVDSSGLTGSASNTFTTSYVSPDPVKYTITPKLDTEGFIEVDWSNMEADTRIAAWRVYRRTMPNGEWELLQEINDETVRTYRDYMVRSGRTYMYNVTQMADRSGELLESPVGTGIMEDDSVEAESRIFLVVLDQYWLIVPDQPNYSMLLPNVTSADEDDEYEDAVINLIGRGRHVDYGDELGYRGTLTFQIMQPEIESEARVKFEDLRRLRETYWLRTPFGKLYQVALGNPSWKYRAGTGLMEMGDMTFDWYEVK